MKIAFITTNNKCSKVCFNAGCPTNNIIHIVMLKHLVFLNLNAFRKNNVTFIKVIAYYAINL